MVRAKIIRIAFIFAVMAIIQVNSSEAQNFRPPAYPLLTNDPFLSIWSFNDTLYKGPTRHWTGKIQSLQGVIRVDGKSMYFLGQPIDQVKVLLPLSKRNSGRWEYTFTKPGSDWFKSDYNDSHWKIAYGPFSKRIHAKNRWNTHDIWVRRHFNLTSIRIKNLYLNLHHDDNVTVYLNGLPVYQKNGWVSSAILIKMGDAVKKILKKQDNVLAIHCVNTSGGAYLDAGLSEKIKSDIHLPTALQTGVHITATQTKYDFNCKGVQLNVTFTDPLLPYNLDILSRPADYITFKVHSLDGKKHNVQLYFSAAGNLAVNTKNQNVVWKRIPDNGLSVMRVGTKSQNILAKKGDNVRIDWGYMYLAAPKGNNLTTCIQSSDVSVDNFTKTGKLSNPDDHQMPRPAGIKPITLAASYNLGNINHKTVTRHLIIAYDELYPIELFHKRLKAWWKRSPEMTAVEMLNDAEKDYIYILSRCDAFDKKLYRQASQDGGIKYARLCELAYRQALAACKLADGPNGTPMFFSKENFSNGDISTVDVIYPTSPELLYYNPTLLKGLMDPVFFYSESGRFTKPYAPHDLGTYPIANGRKHEETMPIEESGNMIILSAAISTVEGNASYARKHWKVLTKWADFLLKNGMDPKNQLCTDDFAGRTAHNANLSIKAIIGIACYGKMAGMLGYKKTAQEYIQNARRMAQKWIRLDQEGNHFKLTFDRNNTWSQKYNLVWDKVLDLNIFPKKVAKMEVAYYLTKQNKYGLPLDSRATYTKSDWITWTATLSGNKATFEKFINPEYRYVNETPDRVPMSDWYQTTNAKQVGFQARSVVGAYFMKMLDMKLNEH